MTLAVTLCQLLAEEVAKHATIEFHVGKDGKDHTFIVIKFNGSFSYTLDLGTSKVAGIALATGSKVLVNAYKALSNTMLVRDLLEFSISSSKGKERAISLLISIAQLVMKHSDVIIQKGREFVKKVSEVIFYNKKKNEDRFDDEFFQQTSFEEEYQNESNTDLQSNAGQWTTLISGVIVVVGFVVFKFFFK